jgi:hypothetical protein
MNDLTSLTPVQLKRAAALKEQIAKLEKELAAIFGASLVSSPKPSKMSAAGRAKVAAAQKARWAKVKGSKKVETEKPKTKRTLSPAARAKIVAA